MLCSDLSFISRCGAIGQRPPHLEIKDKSEHSMPIPPEHHPVFLSFGRPCWQAVLGRCPIAPHLEIKDKSEHSMTIPPEHHPVFCHLGDHVGKLFWVVALLRRTLK